MRSNGRKSTQPQRGGEVEAIVGGIGITLFIVGFGGIRVTMWLGGDPTWAMWPIGIAAVICGIYASVEGALR